MVPSAQLSQVTLDLFNDIVVSVLWLSASCDNGLKLSLSSLQFEIWMVFLGLDQKHDLLLLAPTFDEVFLFEGTFLPDLGSVPTVLHAELFQCIFHPATQYTQSDSILRMNVDSDMLTLAHDKAPGANSCRDVDHDAGDGRCCEVHLTPGRVELLPLP